MNTLKLISAAAILAATVMTSCRSDDDVITGDDRPVEVRFSANTAEIQTRVTDNSWALDDPVGIYMIDADEGLATEHIKESADNREYRAAAGSGAVAFTAEGSKIYYPVSGNVEFIAYYPYKASLSDFKLPVNVGTQTSQSAIDVLYAPKTNGSYNKSATSPVALAFTHKLVKLVFSISAPAEYGVTESLDGLAVKITNQQTAATLDLTNGNVTSSGGTSEITANTAAGGASSEAIVLPNDGVSDMTFTFTTAAGGVYEVAVPAPTTNSRWEPGTKYTYTVTLKRNEADISGSASGWDDGGAYSVTGISPVIIEGYAGDIEVTYTESEPVTIASITLTDFPGKTYLIGRAVDAANPIHLKFDGNGELVFRDASADGFIPIGSYAEFQKIRDHTQNNYRQEADLDLMNEEWTPVANDGIDFFGEFDGAGKEISNLKITGNVNPKGLFRVNWGTIRNVHIVSGTITAGSGNSIGGICGSNCVQIISCTNAATVSGTSGTNFVGGVAGNNGGDVGTVIACYNTGAVSGGNYVGGVVGWNYSSYATAVTACYNTGTVTGSGNYVGGVAGYNEGTVTACYWESTTATNGIGGGNGTVDGVNGFTLSDYFTPSGSDAWGTGTGEENGWWKPGTTDGSHLPKLWFEI
jgi:hypothetical protein